MQSSTVTDIVWNEEESMPSPHAPHPPPDWKAVSELGGTAWEKMRQCCVHPDHPAIFGLQGKVSAGRSASRIWKNKMFSKNKHKNKNTLMNWAQVGRSKQEKRTAWLQGLQPNQLSEPKCGGCPRYTNITAHFLVTTHSPTCQPC